MTTKIIDRTYPMTAVAKLGVANIGADKGASFSLPLDAVLLRITALTAVGFNPGGTGTATLTVTDGTTTFVNAVDIESTGSETVANAPKAYPAGGTITATITETVDTTASTVGTVYLVAEYARPGNGIAGVQE